MKNSAKFQKRRFYGTITGSVLLGILLMCFADKAVVNRVHDMLPAEVWFLLLFGVSVITGGLGGGTTADIEIMNEEVKKLQDQNAKLKEKKKDWSR